MSVKKFALDWNAKNLEKLEQRKKALNGALALVEDRNDRQLLTHRIEDLEFRITAVKKGMDTWKKVYDRIEN